VSLLEYATIGKDAVVYASLAVLLAVVMFPVVSYGIKKLFRQGFAFVLIAVCFLYAMANKPDPGTYPQITWSAGLFNSGSTFNTNTWKTINFRWSNNATVSLTDTIYFAAKDRNYPDLEYFELGSTQVEQHQWSYTFDGQENVTNYIYYAFTLGNIHTNDVWLGQILQKELPGTGGPDKMIFIRSKLYENGKQLTPTKE